MIRLTSRPGTRRQGPLLLLLFLAGVGGRSVAAGQTEQQAAPQYDLTIHIEPSRKHFSVEGAWTLSAASVSRDSISFFLWQEMQDVEVDLVEPPGLGPVRLTGSGEGDRIWTLDPAEPIPAGREVVLQISYRWSGEVAPQFIVAPVSSLAGGFGQLWYPQLEFGIRDVGRLRFLVPPEYTVVSNGILVGDLDERSRGEFVFEVDEPAKFSFAVGRYRILDHPGDPSISMYLLHDHPDAGSLLSGISRGLRMLAHWFGPTPFPRISIAEVEFPSTVRGTSEFGIILAHVSVFENETDLAYWLHELGHQWWGILVGTRSGTPGRMMLSEGITQFGAMMGLEAVEGPEAAENFRRSRYQGTAAHSSREYFRLAAAEMEVPIAGEPPEGQREVILVHRLANTRGFFLLDMLARLVGQERFLEILRGFVREKVGQRTSWDEFQTAVEAGATESVSWFFEQWFERTGAPDYRLSWRQEGNRILGSVTQPTPSFDAKVEIEIRGKGEGLVRELMVRGPRTDFVWDTPFEVEDVVLDPAYRVLRWTPELREEAEALAAYTRADFERRYGDDSVAVRLYQAALKEVPEPDPLGVRFLTELGLGRALLESGDPSSAREHVELALRAPVRPAENLPWAYVTLARALHKLGEVEELSAAVEDAFSADLAAGGRTGASAVARELVADCNSNGP